MPPSGYETPFGLWHTNDRQTAVPTDGDWHAFVKGNVRMNKSLDRREFATRTAAFVAGLSMKGRGKVCAEEHSLTEKELVRLGINALARAPEMVYFADGHRGAAMITAHMMYPITDSVMRRRVGSSNCSI